MKVEASANASNLRKLPNYQNKAVSNESIEGGKGGGGVRYG
jgi:hypothetical protein